VLVNLAALKEGHGRTFAADCVARLNRLTQESGARLVVSSVWRKQGLQALRLVFDQQGVVARISGLTPTLDRVPRGREIRAWLDEHPEVESFVILDDDADMEDLRPWLVQTDPLLGLVDADVERALAVLSQSRGGPDWSA